MSCFDRSFRCLQKLRIMPASLKIMLLEAKRRPHKLPILTLIWGFFSALTQAIAVVMPAKLFKKYSTMTILAWGLLLSGILFTPFIIFMPAQHVTFKEWTLVIYIVIAGTILAYTLYLSSVVYISAGLASMLEAFEPLVATILSVGLLGSDFGIMKMVGGSLIIFATFLQVIPSPRPGKLHRDRL